MKMELQLKVVHNKMYDLYSKLGIVAAIAAVTQTIL